MSDHVATESDPDGEEPVARVNVHPDEALDEPLDDEESPVLEAETPIARSWTAKAIPLGILALIIIIVSMLLILQGSFTMLPD